MPVLQPGNAFPCTAQEQGVINHNSIKQFMSTLPAAQIVTRWPRCRLDLLEFFKQECEERGATIIYATHVSSTMLDWAQLLLSARLLQITLTMRIFHALSSMLAAPRLAGRPTDSRNRRCFTPFNVTFNRSMQIFDGLAPWITHLAYLEGGHVLKGASL